METRIDDIDGRILSLLGKDAKMRMHLIAKKLGIPPSTAHHRIKRMEREGIITGYSVRKDHRKMGQGIKAHVLVFVDVSALKRMRKSQEDIADELCKVPGAEGAEIITGEADLLLTLRAQDMDCFRKVLLGKIQAIDGITETRTMMVVWEKGGAADA